MRLFLYYIVHSFWGVIRKLAHTWVAIFLLVCLLIGAAAGLGAGLLMDAANEPAPLTVEEPAVTPDDIPAPDVVLPSDGVDTMRILELLVSGGILLIFALQLMGAEKSASKMFRMADVNLLFPAPKKPQSVLLLRLCGQMGLYLVVTVYLTLQIPNLIESFGLPAPAAWSLLIVLFFSLALSSLCSALVYTAVSTHPRWRGKVQYALYGVPVLLVGALILFCRAKGLGMWEGAIALFCAKWTRYVPVFGFLKAIPLWIVEQNALYLSLDLVFLVLLCVGLCALIYSMDADFYEDAISGAAEREDMMQRARENRFGMAFKKRKARPDGAVRPLHLGGAGASVFFSKSVRCRARSAVLHVFSGASMIYLFFGIAGGATARLLLHTNSTLVLALPFCAVVFMRSLKNPVADDVAKPYFLLIPESAFKKIACGMLGESFGTFSDLLPGLILGELLLGAPIWKVSLWCLFLISFDFYTSSLGVFADLSLPESVPQKIKSSVQIMLLYVSVVPSGAAIGIAKWAGAPFIGVLLAILINVGVGVLFTSLSPVILNAGRK